jgi:heme/copper-type cytochrome/quinol oxidase subunit 3
MKFKDWKRKLFKLVNIIKINDYYRKYSLENKRIHKFHIVDRSPWPFRLSISILIMLIGLVMYLHLVKHGGKLFLIGLTLVILISGFWFTDIIREATYLGHHTSIVQIMIKRGMILFILSEIMLFFAFFWAFFHSSLSPSVWIGSVWPPKGIVTPIATGIPLLNTALLVFSGVTITLAQTGIEKEDYRWAHVGFLYTIFCAVLFLCLQVYEYIHLSFTLADSVYGSCFYMLTGLHGFHVLLGTLIIIVSYFRFLSGHFNRKHHLGLKMGAWYWHFVDAVWILLFIWVYVWGNTQFDNEEILKLYKIFLTSR